MLVMKKYFLNSEWEEIRNLLSSLDVIEYFYEDTKLTKKEFKRTFGYYNDYFVNFWLQSNAWEEGNPSEVMTASHIIKKYKLVFGTSKLF